MSKYKKIYYEKLEQKFDFNEKELCKVAKISFRDLKKIKNGNPRVRISVILDLATYLDCARDDILMAFF